MARLFTGAAILSIALVACEAGLDSPSAFPAAWSRWNRLRPAEYTYDLQRLCYCHHEAIEPVRISVSNGVVVNVLALPGLTPVPPEQVSQFYRVTLDSVFGIVRQAIDNDADAITVRYDPQWGYPTAVSIDYLSNAIDDELSVTSALQSP